MSPYEAKRSRGAGLTLIELLVALAVFAVLGTLTWRGSSQMIDTQRLLAAQLERWRAIQRAMQIVELSLIQVAARPSAKGAAVPPALVLNDGRTGTELSVLTLSGETGVQRVFFRLEADRWIWARRMDDGLATGHSGDESDVLLTGVKAVDWRFLGPNGWVPTWPASANAAAQLPAGVELRMELDDVGLITRIYALR